MRPLLLVCTGEDEAEQLACIMEVIGLPPPHLLAISTRRKLFFDSNNKPRPSVNSHNRTHTPGMCGADLHLLFMAHVVVLACFFAAHLTQKRVPAASAIVHFIARVGAK